MRSDVVPTIAALVWAGRQQQAIDAATEALEAPGLDAALRLALLDQRAQALTAEGRYADAARDAAAMLALAEASGQAAPRVRALIRQALVQMRLSEVKAAPVVARQAVTLAQADGSPDLLAAAVLCEAEALLRAAQPEAAAAAGAARRTACSRRPATRSGSGAPIG